MKALEGRVGKQEAASTALLAAVISGIFSINTSNMYADGNSSYLSAPLSAMVSLAAFLLAGMAMEASGAKDLSQLYTRSLGKLAGGLMGVITALALVVAAAVPLSSFLFILSRYVYVEAEAVSVALYFLPAVMALSVLGLESVTRTAKLFIILVLLSLATAFVVAAPAYYSFRLYPILGDGLVSMLRKSLEGISRFSPALTALLIVCRGVQGTKNAALAGRIAAIGGGAMVGAALLLLGMTYTPSALGEMHAPMYRLTMSVRTGSTYIRTDKLLLFFWTLGGMLAGAYYVYAAALMYTRSMGMRDIRPSALGLGALTAALALIGHESAAKVEPAVELITKWLWAAFIVPPLISMLAALRFIGRRNGASKGSEQA